jgi:threonine dehydratase
VGGGGLISGVACAVKETNPKIKVIGVQSSRIASMKAALDAHKLVTLPANKTIADGIAVRSAGTVTFPLVQKYVDEIVTVDEEEIASAILQLLEKEKMLAEGAGAAATAALLNQKTPNHGKTLGVLVSAGNIDVSLLSLIIRRGLVKDGRLVRLRIHLPDHPGALQKLAGVIADQKANIVETMYDRAYYGVVLGDAVIDITMETRGPEHVAHLTAALETSGYTFERVQ